ncbi:MAG: VIT1/CCC1 transporter family protein [Actinobacteria bacterium]|nr:VIT1/CCC1 transporter family protein [Actinomycetota bacterium]MBW3641859.1 VIT1/CCC1 transporter family protein [Actinomycetota bacterium]
MAEPDVGTQGTDASPAGADRGLAPGDHLHRDVQGGTARAAVFGVSDGLVSNVGLILGVAGADPAPSVVRLAGLAGLVAGAISMAAGEYNSMRVQTELLERELELERLELRRNPEYETAELSEVYESRGMPAEQARSLAETVMRDPEVALETHAREELGVDPARLGSPLGAAAWSFASFSFGALVPLVPWFVGSGKGAMLASLVLAVALAVAVGGAIGRFTGRPRLRTVARQVVFTLVPAALTYAIGALVGVGVT